MSPPARRLVDTLPKHWGGGAGGAGGAGDVAAALAQKLERHGALLRALGADGLAALQPAAVRCLSPSHAERRGWCFMLKLRCQACCSRRRAPTAWPPCSLRLSGSETLNHMFI